MEAWVYKNWLHLRILRFRLLTHFFLLSLQQMNSTLSFPSWRKVSAEAVHPGTAFSSPWQCSFWALSSSPSNGRSISVTMPTSLGKVYPISGWESREWVWRRREENWFCYKHFFKQNPANVWGLRDLCALGDPGWAVFCIKVSLFSQVLGWRVRDCVISEPGGGACWITHTHHLKHLYKRRCRKKKEIQPPNWKSFEDLHLDLIGCNISLGLVAIVSCTKT